MSVSFLIRIWCDEHGLHATARDITREELDEFGDIVALTDFIAARASAQSLMADASADPAAR